MRLICLFSTFSDAGASHAEYRYQLEAFIDEVRGRTPEHWYDAQDSIVNMQWIEAVYREVGPVVLLLVLSLSPWSPCSVKGSSAVLLTSASFFSPTDWARTTPLVDGRGGPSKDCNMSLVDHMMRA
jgi:hypothetical protein